jgi:threonine dehydrogenase-like Zn-dependent dehydrogenase
MIASGEIDVEPLITHTFPFDRVLDADEMVHTRSDNCSKIVVELSGGG